MKVSKHPVEISCSEMAEMLLGRCDLSQGGYKSLRTILEKNNVKIPRYENVRSFCDKLIVGKVSTIHDENENDCPCMGVRCNVHETLQLIVSNKKLFNHFHFPPEEEQKVFFEFLKEKNSVMYHNMNEKKRTIFIRVTGDNFRASARMPTEQTSFSVLNVKELLNCPYGQFITTLWRGSESREMIEKHVTNFFNEIVELVKTGIVLEIDNQMEEFNVVCFFVADLCFVKDVIGQCSCTKKKGNPKTMEGITKFGMQAVKVLGKNLDRSSSTFTNFQQSHFGQWV